MNELTKVAFSDKKIILIERCMLTDKVFFDINVENGFSNPMEEAMFKNLYEFLSNNVYPKLSGIIFLDTSVDECLKRIEKRGRSEEVNLERKYLMQLNDAFLDLIVKCNVPILRLDGNYDLKEGFNDIGIKLFEFIKKQIDE